MKNKTNGKNDGITLIALIITIIVMLILAGVSLNAVIGENGILTQAISATEATKLAQIKEDLEYMFLDYNMGDDEDSISQFLNSKVNDGSIDEFKTVSTGSSLQMIIKKDGYYFYVAQSNGTYYASEMETSLDNVSAGFAVVTEDSFSDGGVMSLDPGTGGETTVIFYDEISGEMNFEIKSGTVTIYITQDMTLTNEDMDRSAVDISSGATLNLYFVDGAEMYVDSGVGTSGNALEAGEGGYAGVHVPEGATLNLYGEGTLIAIGGDAGDGSTNINLGSSSSTQSGAGGGGAGAGIGGNGGTGGSGKSGLGDSGKEGENCGTVNIYNSVIVYAYGGSGGSGSQGTTVYMTSPDAAGGGGGYPAARNWSVEELVGAGATCCAGGGGYSGGSGQCESDYAVNGEAGYPKDISSYSDTYAGGGYYSGIYGNYYTKVGDGEDLSKAYMGFFGLGYESSHMAGSGGQAGSGGIVSVSEIAQIYAYNGNMYTDGTDYEDGLNQAVIYLQAGVIPAKYEYTYQYHAKYTIELVSSISYIDLTGYANLTYDNTVSDEYRYITKNDILTNVDMSTQGVGSGAGYIEVSNGTYTIDSSMN